VSFGQLQNLKSEDYDVLFEGVFCKFSINAFWFYDNDTCHINYIKTIAKLICPGGWAWIAPWNGVPKQAELSEADIERVLNIQSKTFKDLGFAAVNLTKELTLRYGVHGNVANRALFTLNIKLPESLRDCGSL